MVRSTLDNLLTGQSVMLATNQIMWAVAAFCAAAAFVICFAPRPQRAVSLAQAGH
jgi:DHA2 family multidrug resistance protein